MAATCMAVCKGSRKKIRGIFISSCHLPVAVECDIVILSEPGPIPQAPVGQFCRHNLSPRGDGNSSFRARPTTAAGHNLSPRGDGNSALINTSAGGGDTTYPREGTETGCAGCFCRSADDTTYPREGTETAAHRAVKPCAATQLIPARGRKLRRRHNHVKVVGHNLSPRGDGNAAAHRAVKPCAATQLIPARGRKPNLGPGALL